MSDGAVPDRIIRIVVAVIRDADGRVLLVRKRGARVFQQPGGKPDPADAGALATLARELREEIGCAMVPGSAQWLRHARAPAANEPGHEVQAEVFAVEVSGVPVPGAEIDELRWVDPAAPQGIPIATLSREHVLPYL